jgi:limonene-1,2-epoxide hydrolase
MTLTAETHTSATGVEDVVLTFIDALNQEDFEAARDFAGDNMKFVGVLGERNGADAYFADMKNMRFKYKIKKTFADGDDVCLLCDIDMGNDTSIFACGWYHVSDGRIDRIQVIFDPRPVLDKK